MRKIRTRGFSMIEVTVAIGVTSFAMLAIFGVLPVGLLSNQTSIQQTLATNIATGIVADMQQVPTAGAITASSGTLNSISSKYGIDVSGSNPVTSGTQQFYVDESGARQASATAARYSVTVTLARPSGSRQATDWIVSLGWPAMAQRPLDHVSVFVALDRN